MCPGVSTKAYRHSPREERLHSWRKEGRAGKRESRKGPYVEGGVGGGGRGRRGRLLWGGWELEFRGTGTGGCWLRRRCSVLLKRCYGYGQVCRSIE